MEAAAARKLINALHVPLKVLTYYLHVTALSWPPQATVKDGDSFCHIVVGSGAGSVIANRLTEDENCTVLLIEAGGDPSIESSLPGLFFADQNSYQDWIFKGLKEEASQSQEGGDFNLAAGKCLGGSSAINHFIFARGARCDFDRWAKELNDESLSFDNLLYYFKKSEAVNDDTVLSLYGKYHNDTGPTKLTREVRKSGFRYLKSFEEVGQNVTVDFNRNVTVGYGFPMLTIDTLRQSTAQDYLHNIKDRKNLYVLKQAVVIKILFKCKRAVGVVVVLKDGTTINLYARNEVIISAGVYNTPKLLMLSGIGPRELLTNLNISVLEDLPVGDNLQDHVAVTIVHKMEKSIEISELPTLTVLPFPIVIGASNLDNSNCPEYQSTNLIITHDTPYGLIGCSILFGYKDEICTEISRAGRGRNILYTLLAVVHPESRGNLIIKSADYKDDPIIKMNYYSDKRDVDNMVSYLQHFLKVNQSKYFKEVNSEFVDLNLPYCKNLTFLSVEYLKCYIKHVSTTEYHQTSSCAMGKVVHTNYKVMGVSGLRVVDASVFPNVTRANPLATVIALAERAADLIKKDNKCTRCNCK